jgi:hypothetical protein
MTYRTLGSIPDCIYTPKGLKNVVTYIHDGARGCSVFHIAAMGDWLEWGKRILGARVRIDMKFSSHGRHGELDAPHPVCS